MATAWRAQVYVDPEFEPILSQFHPDALEKHTGTIYGLWPDLRLAYLNPGWFVFARENRGEPAISTHWGLGTSVLDAISGDLKDFYAGGFGGVLSGGQPWEHEYECSTAELFRQFHMRVLPLRDGAGLLVIHSVRVERVHDPARRAPRLPDERRYRNREGFIRQCSNCRRVQVAGETDTWEWVPAYVRWIPPNTTHGICPICVDFYFPSEAGSGD